MQPSTTKFRKGILCNSEHNNVSSVVFDAYVFIFNE